VADLLPLLPWFAPKCSAREYRPFLSFLSPIIMPQQ
jgi:hypothetical protein